MHSHGFMLWRCALVLVGTATLAAPVLAATPGFRQDFTSGTGGFGAGGGVVVTQVGSGGVGGGADPYLSVAQPIGGFLGTFSSGPEFVGNLPASGVTGYSFWLRGTGANDNLEIHVGVGIAFSNFWLSIPGFVPPDGSWQRFTVDVTDPSQWVQIIGTGTFAAAVAASDRLLFRHDVPPLVNNPDTVTADFGLDRILVLPAAVPAVSAPGRAVLGLLLVALAGFAVHRQGRMLLAPSP